MGIRFRKSYKIGKSVRINLSKSGIGYSIGTKGARVTRKANGGSRTTISAPGTGLSYVKEHGQARTNKTHEMRGQVNMSGGQKKRKTWLWVLGWIFIFPLPLTILMLRKKEMKPAVKYGIIAAAWFIYLFIAYLSSSTSSDPNKNVESISISRNSEITVKIGEKYSEGQASVDVKSRSSFSPEDIVFVSENPQIATIAFTEQTLTTYLKYEVTGVSGGETYVYATNKDGSVSSQKLKVTVPQPIDVMSVELEEVDTALVIGNTAALKASVKPENADDKSIKWESSDASVVKVDDKGNITAVSGGTATVTASSNNGKSKEVEFTVDGSKRVMTLNVSRKRVDDNNIGDSWSYVSEINGSSATKEFIVAAGDVLNFHSKFTEEDDNPDIGEASKKYTVTQDDFNNGFSVTMDLSVAENGGKNSGQRAAFVITYTFTPK